MTFRLGCVRLRLHPLLPLLWVIAFIGGAGRFLAALAALLLHESGHWMAARLCGVPITEVEITPLGGVMTVQNPEAISRSRQFLLALAWPVFSAAGCMAAVAAAKQGLRVTLIDRNEKIGRKIRDNELGRVPYMVIVGEKEAAEGLVSMRKQGGGEQATMPMEDFAARVNAEVAEMLKATDIKPQD